MTLIEIIMALAILGIVAALAIPVYEGYVTEAKLGTAIKDIRQMELILNDAYLENAPPATLAAAGINMTDPWGNPYQYRYPATKSKKKYDLWSNGENGIEDSGEGEGVDDIGNW